MARRVDESAALAPPVNPTIGPSAMTALMSLVRHWTSEDFQRTLADRAGVDIESRDIPALLLLALRGPMQPGNLARTLRVTAGNVSKIVERLAVAGFAVRVAAAHDARASLVVLTPEGETASTALYRQGERQLADLLDGWPQHDIDTFTRLVMRLAERAGSE